MPFLVFEEVDGDYPAATTSSSTTKAGCDGGVVPVDLLEHLLVDGGALYGSAVAGVLGDGRIVPGVVTVVVHVGLGLAVALERLGGLVICFLRYMCLVSVWACMHLLL